MQREYVPALILVAEKHQIVQLRCLGNTGKFAYREKHLR